MRQYSVALLIVILLVYLTGILIEKSENNNFRKIIYPVSVIFSISLLLYFKYYFDFSIWLSEIFNKKIIPVKEPFVFVGISFVVFQIIGYLYDVFHKNVHAEKNILNFTLFVLFFPKLVSGPIEKAKTFLPQIRLNEKKEFNLEDFLNGLKIFVFGFFAKVVIANRLDPAVNIVFANPFEFNSLQNLTAALFFTFQLYSDFMGYSYMAVGISKMLGYSIVNNFHLPLFSESISDFWKRWHISLSNWFRDYIFLPLNYKIVRLVFKYKIKFTRPENISYVLGTLITMTLCGVWHGSGLSFILWGLLQGVYMSFSFVTKKTRNKLLNNFGIRKNNTAGIFLKHMTTFVLIVFSFVVFKAASPEKAFELFYGIFSFDFGKHSGNLFYGNYEPVIAFAVILLLMVFEFYVYKKDKKSFKVKIEELISYPVLLAIVFMIVFLGKFAEIDFLYFKF